MSPISYVFDPNASRSTKPKTHPWESVVSLVVRSGSVVTHVLFFKHLAFTRMYTGCGTTKTAQWMGGVGYQTLQIPTLSCRYPDP